MTDDRPATRSHEPQDRLTKLGAEMVKVLDETIGAEDVKAIVMLHDETGGGIALHGYDDDKEAMAAMLTHLSAIFEANGAKLSFMSIDEDGVTRRE